MRICTIFLVLAALFATPAAAQPPGILNYWEAANGNWNTAANWSRGSVPDGVGITGDDFAIVGGVDGTTGDGIAVGETTVNMGVTPQPGGVVLGVGANSSGTLNVTPGGFLTIADTDFEGDGRLTVGDTGTGRLIMTGGRVNAVSLTSGGGDESLIRLSGNAELFINVAGNPNTATLGRTTHITGPGVEFESSGVLTLQETHTLVAEITGLTHSPIASDMGAIINGALDVRFNGQTPALGQSWDLITAPNITGAFDSVTVQGADNLPLGQALSLRTTSIGLPTLQLFVEQRLVLNVDRATGAVSIQNVGPSTIQFDAYSIQSAGGALDDGMWNSLQNQIGATWTEANPSPNGLTEFRSTSTTIMPPSQFNLGDIFDPPAPTEFGQVLEDLVFTYSSPNSPQTQGIVNYTGSSGTNNLVLFADPSTGNVALRNTSPFTVAFDAYTISSEEGDLLFTNGNWNSLDDQNAAGGDWVEANVSANRVTEFKQNGATTLSPNTTFDLGELYMLNGSADLVFEFLLSGESAARIGNVIYGPAPSIGELVGDYNEDGIVNAADYVVWRNNEGTTNPLPNDPIGGTIGAAQYNQWADNFGSTSGSGSTAVVPEPACGLLASFAALALAAWRRGRPAEELRN